MKSVNYRCKACKKGFWWDLFNTNDPIPEEVEVSEVDKCTECGGREFEKFNFKANDQVWRFNL